MTRPGLATSLLEEPPYPAFKEVLSQLIAESALRKLAGDSALAGYFHTIDLFETEDLLAEDTHDDPTLAVMLDALEIKREGSNRGGRLIAIVPILQIRDTTGQSSRGWQRGLQTRIVEHCYRLFEEDKGKLFDETGRPLTESLLIMQRVPRAKRLPPSRMSKEFRFAFEAVIRNVATGEFDE